MDPLKYLFETPALSGRFSRWLILLAEFNLKYVARKTIKGSVVSDFCVENPIKEEHGKDNFPNKDILEDVLQRSRKSIWEWDRNTLKHS